MVVVGISDVSTLDCGVEESVDTVVVSNWVILVEEVEVDGEVD